MPDGIGGFLHISQLFAHANGGKDGTHMKQDEKQPIPWEAKDPKPPVIHSGHLENRKQS